MSLYEYTLYVVREEERGDLLAACTDGGLVRVEGDPSTGDDLEGDCIGGRVSCIVRHSHNHVDPSLPLDIVTLALDERSFEALLRDEPNELSKWLWEVAQRVSPVCYFMTGGGDVSYWEGGQSARAITFTQLPRLVADGEVRVVHPIMYFAERIAGGSLCRKASGAPWPMVDCRPGVGCLLLLTNVDPATRAIDIIEPGNLYDSFRRFWD